jgi:hypothetical protein
MYRFMKPYFEQCTWPFKKIGLGLLVVSLLALLLAPLQMPASYSWLSHTTSESAAQGIFDAWIARLGFLVFGLAVFWISDCLRGQWSIPVRLMHMAFGVFIVATAALSTRSWLPDAPFDPVEDALHSFNATAMGVAFATGVLLRFFQREHDMFGRIMAIVAVIAAIVIPLAMSALPDWDGLLQRGMFTIAYIWYGFELLRAQSGKFMKAMNTI